MSNRYVCPCGKVFSTANSINGHKSHCTVHLLSIGRLHIRQEVDSTMGEKIKAIAAQRRLKKKHDAESEWSSTEHYCERCGSLMLTMYASGRYCSRSCANTRTVYSDETRQKISVGTRNSTSKASLQALGKTRHMDAVNRYNESPKKCEFCGGDIPYERKHLKGCSKECSSKLMSTKVIDRRNATGMFGGHKQYKHGHYKGIQCDSSWELAFLVFNIENNIPIKRADIRYSYVYEGKQHTYYPDFIVGDTIVEIKNYWTPQVQSKIDQLPEGVSYKILYRKDMTQYLTYCSSKYGKKFWEVLYE